MKERLLDLVRDTADPGLARNLAREYLQARILLALQDAGAMIPLALQGGTALRFLYDLPRFSEDLDFALERPGRSAYHLEELGGRVRARLEREGYRPELKLRSGRAVESLTIGFEGLLNEVGLSPYPSEKLKVRVETDRHPPAGAGLATTVVRRHAMLNLQHHDRASLLAGKLHALLQRQWTKGRDLFDLFWYLSDRRWPGPNMTLLNNALVQTGWSGPVLDETTWRSAALQKVEATDWKTAAADVAPFLEPGPHVALFDRDNLLGMLRRSQPR